MPQIDNKDILGCILRSTINVIGRRTSESYANVFISKTLRELSEKYSFLQSIEIKGTQYSETIEIVSIDSDVNDVEINEIGKATNDFMIAITKSMGKNAGYFFIREIKETLPFDYELAIKKIGVDLDLIQLQFVTETKEKFKFKIENYDILTYSFKALFNILEKEFDKDVAILTLTDLIFRLKTQYGVLNKIEINDIRSIQGVDLVSVDKDVNSIEASKVGEAIQKCFQDINKYFNEKSKISLVNELREYLNADYLFKLEEIGVDLDILQLSQVLVFKNILKALVDIINETTSQAYAVLLVNNVLRKYEDRFEYLEKIKVDGARFSEGVDGIIVPNEINSIRSSELGRGIRKIMEDIIGSLGEEAGSEFVNKFKKRVGKAHLMRIEEIGVNLHLMELKQNLSFKI
jgi:hypothetical protein